MSEENIPVSAYAKHYGKQVVVTVVSTLATWGLTLFIEKCKNDIYNKLIKKPFCAICGGSGRITTSRLVDGETVTSEKNCPSCTKPRKPLPECFNKPLNPIGIQPMDEPLGYSYAVRTRYTDTTDELGSGKFYKEVKFGDLPTKVIKCKARKFGTKKEETD